MSTGAYEVIEAAFGARGGDLYGETVTQLQHALQCAFLAEQAGASVTLVAAALLHDYGHLFEGRGEAAERAGRDARHEIWGARALKRWFGPEVATPVALHVAAKRYLCATEASYEAALSPASKFSLELQGGRFTPAQCRRFEQRPFAADSIRLRRWDDEAKDPSARTRGLASYRPLLEGLVRAIAAEATR
jgi:phosphonate degradation associated HDIG domain protein